MPEKARVTVSYGPYNSNGRVAHRTFRLEGLQASLKRGGHVCVMEESYDWNMVDLIVSGEIVFTCHIRQLEFGGDGILDPVCKEAVAAVDKAY